MEEGDRTHTFQRIGDIVVADAGPIIALAQIGELDLLARSFGRVIIPPAVRRELRSVSPPSWIEVVHLLSNADPHVTLSGLGSGESEAITLAVDLQAGHVLLDDRSARIRAERMGRWVIGTLGLLANAKDAGLIDVLRPYLDALRVSGFYIGDQLYEMVLRDVGE